MTFPRHDVQGIHQQEVRYPLGFKADGSSAPSVIYGRAIASVAHTGTGVWTVTLKEKFRVAMIGLTGLAIKRASAADSNPQFGPYTLASGTLVVRVHTAGSLADIGSDEVFFDLVARYGNVAEGATYVSS